MIKKWAITFLFIFIIFQMSLTKAGGAVYEGNPDTYVSLLAQLAPGDTLRLLPGVYTDGMFIQGMNGTATAPIRIEGPVHGGSAVFRADPCACQNTIDIRDSSYIEIRNLELDGQQLFVDAVKAGGDPNSNWAHHITLENLFIHDYDADQQAVGISTKIPAWDWVIRGNVINGAGTGIYLGDSTGGAPFINGLVEGNLVMDTPGYNMQIKHQNERPSLPGIPTSGKTIIRHNVFSKANNGATGANARPNLLVGHWPLAGAGMNDVYEIYGNFFYENPTAESLFQGEGNLALYNNLFVTSGDAIAIRPHNDLPRGIHLFNNTVVAAGMGIQITGVAVNYTQQAAGNAVFATVPLNVAGEVETADNITASYANASNSLTNPFALPGSGLDLFPLPGMLIGTPLDTTAWESFTDWDQDFNGALHDGTFRGAYAGNGSNPGWLPQLARKPLGSPGTEQLYLPFLMQ
jgi:hypothetical protein